MKQLLTVRSPFTEVYPSLAFETGRQISFMCDGSPPRATAQQKGEVVKGGKVIHYEKENVAEAREWIERRIVEYVPSRPLSGPLCLEIYWVYRWLNRHLSPDGGKKDLVGGKSMVLCPNRPDCDNLSKLFKDCLQAAGFMQDDSQVAVLIFLKAWGDDPGIATRITELKTQ